jgi:hypothetical protein
MVLDHDGSLPQFAVISDGKTADIQAARGLSYTPGTMLVFQPYQPPPERWAADQLPLALG